MYDREARPNFGGNELARLHVRHPVGGHARDVELEMRYRFEFLERPGAWMKFVNSLRHGWNISPFHYRNHGADYGRVRVGMQVSPWPRSGHFPPSRVIVTRKKREIRLAGCSLAERGVLLRQRVAIFQQLRTHFWRRERQPQRAVLRCALPGLDIR